MSVALTNADREPYVRSGSKTKGSPVGCLDDVVVNAGLRVVLLDQLGL